MRPIEFEILLSLARGPRHGYAIILDIEGRDTGAITVETGTLYRALQRLLDNGFVVPTQARHLSSKDDERRRYYTITATGKRAAADEAARMAALVESARAARLIPGST